MTIRKFVLGLFVLLVIGVGGALVYAQRHSALAAITPPDSDSFDGALVERGEELAGLGNCKVCHTRTGGLPYSGGLGLPTPFGLIFSTNITPDAETGIGTWSEAAFVRAMREGVDREGRHLYPAFPYDYFTRVTDEDLGAIYAYLMTREPVDYVAPGNELGFPFNQRLLLAGWKALFLDSGPLPNDDAHDAEWNRGAYLVEGLGHCGACHSTRNRFGAAPKTGTGAFAGGSAEGWYAPPLTDATPAPIPWTQIALVNYLIDGWDKEHGIAAGPMTPIVNDLYEQSEDDIFAIAAYLMSWKGVALSKEAHEEAASVAMASAARLEWGHPDAPPLPEDPNLAAGAAVFERECARCHKANGEPAPLARATAVNAPTSANVVNAVFQGVQSPRGSPDRSMPARAIQISDAEMAALAAFVRDRFTDAAAWTDIDPVIHEARKHLE